MKAGRTLCCMIMVCLALVPSLALAKPPEPKGKLVYSDDFSDAAKSSFADTLGGKDFSRGFHAPGVYQLKLLTAKDTRWVLLAGQSFGTFTVEADVWDNSDTLTGAAAQGLVVRAQDDQHMYAVLLDSRKGQYAVRKLSGTTWSDVVPLTASPLVKQQAEVNHLRVDGEGGNFTVYLNDEQLATFSDASYAKGSIGLIVDSVDAEGAHMHFDNLMLYSPEAPAQTPTTVLPAGGAGDQSTAMLGLLALALVAAGSALSRRTAPRAWR
jgi:hypothetical protein